MNYDEGEFVITGPGGFRMELWGRLEGDVQMPADFLYTPHAALSFVGSIRSFCLPCEHRGFGVCRGLSLNITSEVKCEVPSTPPAHRPATQEPDVVATLRHPFHVTQQERLQMLEEMIENKSGRGGGRPSWLRQQR